MTVAAGWRGSVRATCDAVLAVLLAPACAACGEPLDSPTRGPVCDACWQSVLPLAPPLCDSCGDPLPSWRILDTHRCARCRRSGRLISHARAAGAYDGALRSIVHAIKYEGRRSLASPVAALIRARCAGVLDGADCLVPVPLHPSRRRARGFNQAMDLARAVGGAHGFKVQNALRRIRSTPSQTDLPAARRHGNVRGAFALRRSSGSLQGRIVVLVDDVSTTGATLEACARVLIDAGALEVRAVTAARAVLSRR
jgi:ComF family protein